MPTTELASTIIRSISGDPNDEDAYKRHLALFVSVYVLLICFQCHFLQRLFIRHCDSSKQVSYPLFRLRVDQYYSNIDEEDWGVIMEDDASYSYPSLGHGLGPAATAATIATTSIADAGPIITTARSYTTEGLG